MRFITFHPPVGLRVALRKADPKEMPKLSLSNQAASVAEYKSTQFSWMVYGFNSGHFLSTILSDKLPFHVVVAADYDAHGRALFHEIEKCPTILTSIHDQPSPAACEDRNAIQARCETKKKAINLNLL